MQKVRKEIIPAEELGPLFLQVTKSMLKEILPIVNKSRRGH